MSKIDLDRLAGDREYWDEVSAKQSEFALIRDKKVIMWSFDEPEFWSHEVIPRPTKQEWEGGLPPVGCECEVIFHDDDNPHWFSVEYHGAAHGKIFLYDIEFERAFVPDSNSFEFRPLKSQHEHQREEFVRVVCDIAAENSLHRIDDIAAKVFDDYLSRYTLEPKP